MKLSIVIIGDEILLGRVLDTNSNLIAGRFSAAGWDVVSVRTVGDSADAITEAVRVSLSEADLVISTGGLGPTRDDRTKNVLIHFFGGTLVQSPEVAANVEAIFARRGLTMNSLTRTQAMVPSSCRVIQNTVGTAPVMWFEKDGKVLVAMPGVPAETRAMLPEVMDAAAARFHPVASVRRRELTATGISESALAERLAPFEDALPAGYNLAYLPSPGQVVLRLEGPADDFDARVEELRQSIGDNFAGYGKKLPAQLVLEALGARHLTFSTAESCTGGNIAHQITLCPGSSEVFAGGIVSYSNEVKMGVLGVSADTLAQHGAVSEATVVQMAEGARRVTGADYAVATSGIAGPGGGTPDKPVGTVWTAVATPSGTRARLLTLVGDRQAIIDRATATVLTDLLAAVQNALLADASALLDANRLDAAAALAATHTDAEGLFLQGRIEWKRGNRPEAMALYARAAALDPAGPATTALEQARAIMAFYHRDLYNP